MANGVGNGLGKINESLKGTRSDMALTILAAATAENKFKAIGQAVKDIAIWRMIGPLGIVLGITSGIVVGFRSIVRETGSLEAALRRLSSLQGLRDQFTGLVGGLTQARQRVAELVQFSDRFNQSLERVGKGGRSLEVLTRGTFSTGRALEMVGNSAADSGNKFDAVAEAVGGFNQALRSGESVAGASEQLREMGVISGSAADRIRALEESGGSMSSIWGVVVGELEKADGAMKRHATSVDGVNSRYARAKEVMSEKFGEPFTEAELATLKNTSAILERMSPVAGRLASSMATIANPVSDLKTRFLAWLTGLRGVPTAIEVAVRSLAAFTGGILLLGTVTGAMKLWSLGAGILNFVRNVDSGVGSSQRLAAAMGSLRTGVAQIRAGETAAGLLNLRLAATEGAAGGAGKGVGALAGGLRMAGGAIAGFLGWLGVIVLISAALGYLWQKYEAGKQAEAELNKLKEAHSGVLAEIEKQIDAMRTLDDQISVVAKTAEQYAAAMKAAQEARQKGNWREVDENLKHAQELREKGQKAKDTQVGPSQKQTEVLETNARMEVEQREAAWERNYAQASPDERKRLRTEKLAEEEGKLAEGKTRVSNRADTDAALGLLDPQIAKLEETVGKNFNPEKNQAKIDKAAAVLKSGPEGDKVSDKDWAKAIADIKIRQEKQTAYEELQKAQAERERVLSQRPDEVKELESLNSKGRLSPEEAKRRAALIARKEDLEGGYQARLGKINTLKGQQTPEQLQRLAEQRQMDEESQMASVPGSVRGFERAREEYRIRKEGLAKRLQDERDRGANADPLKMQGLENQQTTLSRDFLETTRQTAVSRLGFTRELEMGKARVAGKGEAARDLGNLDKFSQRYEELRQQMPEKEAQDLAAKLTNVDIAESHRENTSDVVSNLSKIGGGGYQGAGSDAVAIAREQKELAKLSTEYLKSIGEKIDKLGITYGE